MYKNVKTTKTFSVNLCRANPNIIYVFGDNLISRGKAGQAVIRDEPNAFGIPTKRLPSMAENAFFSDMKDEELNLQSKLHKLFLLKKSGKEIVFPEYGLGTGLAKMQEKSPILFKKMNDYITKNFGV